MQLCRLALAEAVATGAVARERAPSRNRTGQGRTVGRSGDPRRRSPLRVDRRLMDRRGQRRQDLGPTTVASKQAGHFYSSATASCQSRGSYNNQHTETFFLGTVMMMGRHPSLSVLMMILSTCLFSTRQVTLPQTAPDFRSRLPSFGLFFSFTLKAVPIIFGKVSSQASKKGAIIDL